MFAQLVDKFRVARTTTIEAPAQKVFELLNDFRHWGTWSPFESIDRATSRSFCGSPNGKGAVYAWSRRSDAGVGRVRLVDSTAPATVTIELEFEKPIACSNTSEFTLRPIGNSTNVSWSLRGLHPFIGRHLESGLASLKAVAEG